MKAETLAKRLEFSSTEELFDYCADSYTNGQRQQCRNLFADLNKEDRKRLLSYLQDNGLNEIFKFYFNLL